MLRALSVFAAISPTVALICSVAAATDESSSVAAAMFEATEVVPTLSASAARATALEFSFIRLALSLRCPETSAEPCALLFSAIVFPEISPTSIRVFSRILVNELANLPSSSRPSIWISARRSPSATKRMTRSRRKRPRITLRSIITQMSAKMTRMVATAATTEIVRCCAAAAAVAASE